MLDALAGSETTLIFASAVTPDKGRTVDALDGNLQMALNVGRYVEQHPFRKIVYVSSDAVYPMDGDVTTQTSPVSRPTSMRWRSTPASGCWRTSAPPPRYRL